MTARTARTFRRAVFCALGLVAFGGAAVASRTPQELTPRPNIVLVLVDDLGWQDTALQLTPEPPAQNQRWHTPNPTLAPPAWRRNSLDASDTTFPWLLSEAGYRTIHVGKAHFGAKGTPGEDPRALGFDVNIAGHAAGHPGSYLGRDDFRLRGRTGVPAASTFWKVPDLEAWFGSETFLTEALATHAAEAVEEAVAAGQPFYLNFAPHAVHTPLRANARLLDHYVGLDEREATYDTMIESVDNALGTLLAKLAELGVVDDTVVLFTSDNGGLSAQARGPAPGGARWHTHNAPLKSGKGSASEGGVRGPLAARWPGHTPAGTWSEQPVITYDLFPTFLAMAGSALPEAARARMEGHDLGTTLRRGSDATLEGRALFWNQPYQRGAPGPGIEPCKSVRLGDWKPPYFYEDRHFELYDLGRDLGEEHDLAGERPDVTQRLGAELSDWLVRLQAKLPFVKDSGSAVPLPRATPTPR